ncbi:putative O-linked N-acetylglucosamine transferase, SPINDLY family [Bacteroidales bacterium Barb6]|nr:putative O-linked N-acetylglucosamine transferase, SPINDLY family [Bacteroidales bacterium Barb6]
MNYLVLHIDIEFIAATVCSGNGLSYPITNNNENLLWLYFFNNPHQNRVAFGKDNKVHFNNSEVNYYGKFFDSIENENNKFTIRGIDKKTIELLEYSGLLKSVKNKYESVTHERSDNVPTLITFSLSIGELAKQKTIDYLKKNGFQIESYTIPLSELVCYYALSQKSIVPANGNVVLFLKASNTTLHLMKLIFSDNYFLIDGQNKPYRARGLDPRKRALIRYVVNEVNKSTGVLASEAEKEEECERLEIYAEEWLKRLDANQNLFRPLNIPSISFSKTPNMKRSVLVHKSDVDSDTGHYIQELTDIFEAYKNDNVKTDVAAIFFLGDCFQNSLVRDKFQKMVRVEQLYFYTNKDIQQILSVYPKIDFKRYIDEEARIKALAEAEELKKAEQRAFEAIQAEKARAEEKKIAEAQKIELNKKEAKRLFERAIELEKNGQLQDARANVENALISDPENTDFQLFLLDLKDKINELKIRTEQYKSLLTKANQLLKENDFTGALNVYELAKDIFDSAEIRNMIIEAKEKKKNHRKEQERLEQEKKYKQKIADADRYLNEVNFDAATTLYNEALNIRPNDNYCLSQLKKIDESIRQQEKSKKRCKELTSDADKLFDEAQWAEAEKKYKEALRLCPKEKQLSNKIKICTDKENEKEEKFKDLGFEATLAENGGNIQQALSLLKKALELKPDDIVIKSRIKKLQFNLGFCNKEHNTEKNNKGKLSDDKKIKKKHTTDKDDFFIDKAPVKESSDDFLNPKYKKDLNIEDDFLNSNKGKMKDTFFN